MLFIFVDISVNRFSKDVVEGVCVGGCVERGEVGISAVVDLIVFEESVEVVV